jgi:hypothetical protein
LTALALATADPAMAICNPGRSGGNEGSKFSGGSNTGRGGVLTDSEVTFPYYTPFIDTANKGSTSAWTMLYQSNCSTGGFAQIGMAEYWNPYSEMFYEIEQCGTFIGSKQLGGQTGQHHYKVQHNGNNPGVVALFADSTVEVGNTSVNWAPNHVADSSETHAADDQNYGGSQNQQLFSQLTQCDGTGCYTNAAFCLFAGNLPNPCSSTEPWLDLTIQGSPAWSTYDRDCPT